MFSAVEITAVLYYFDLCLFSLALFAGALECLVMHLLREPNAYLFRPRRGPSPAGGGAIGLALLEPSILAIFSLLIAERRHYYLSNDRIYEHFAP